MSLSPPPLQFQGQHWSSPALVELACAWCVALRETLDGGTAPVAMVMVNRPEAVALFFALSTYPAPLILLSPESAEWQSSPPIPKGTRLVLLPGFAFLATAAEQIGLRPIVLSGDPKASKTERAPFLAFAGVVLFTSGSTSLPRPVFRNTTQVLAAANDLMEAIGPPAGAGIVTALPIAKGLGFNQGLMAATVLGCELALLERFDPQGMLALFASGRYQYWAGTPMMADWLSRSSSTRASAAPSICVVSGRPPAGVALRFKERFGVPLRQVYGSTEAAAAALDVRAEPEVSSDTAGQPLRGMRLHIGDDPSLAVAPGTAGRIWLSSEPYLAAGYGFPPDIETLARPDGWWPSPDVGYVDEAGNLTVVGRLDDCFRTDAGQLVNPLGVAAALESLPGVVDVAAVPLATPRGRVLGVLVETTEVGVATIRRHLASRLPAWGQPSVLETTTALPRLATGRISRRACIAILEEKLAQG